MNHIAQAICLTALVLSFNQSCTAADESAAHAKLLINDPGGIRCYEDGRVEFQEWQALPGPSILRPRKLVVASTAQLSPEQLHQVVDAVDEYLAAPAPFMYANFTRSDQHYDRVDIRHGQKIRLTITRAFVSDPPALIDLFAKISEPLATAKLLSGDAKRRDLLLTAWKSQKPRLEQEEWLQSGVRGLVSIPNDDPEKLITMLFDASGRHKRYFSESLGFLAALKDTALGDAVYANIQSHRDTLSVEQQSETLAIATRGGSLGALAEYPTLEHSSATLQYRIEEILSPADLNILASRIRVPSIAHRNVAPAWSWLAANTNQLRFDRITHQYHIIGTSPPLAMSRRADILPVAVAQPPSPFVVAAYWSVAILVGWLAAIQIARAVRMLGRAKAGRCVNCGYDLRGTPTRCPECGTPAAATK